MSRPDPNTIPYGYCHCGCGEKTAIADRNRPNNNARKGEPFLFKRGHQRRKHPYPREGFKWCLMCNTEKPLDAFYRSASQAQGRQSQCKECRNKLTYEFRSKHPEYYPEMVRHRRWWTKHGVSQEDYQSTLEQQNYVCAICGEPEKAVNRRGIHKCLSVDHCHETGKVRGLLCSLCNPGLGNFRDRIDLLEKAIEYLKCHCHVTR